MPIHQITKMANIGGAETHEKVFYKSTFIIVA